MPAPKATKERYGRQWPDETDDLEIEIYCIQKGGRWEEKGMQFGEGLFHHYRQMQSLLWPEDDHHRWSDLFLSEVLKNRITSVLGPKDCVHGDTRILNPITGEEPTIRKLEESKTAPIVMTLQGTIQAEVPFVKGCDEMLEVVCDDGSKFCATRKHLVLSELGFVSVGSLYHGQRLVSCAPILQASILEPCLSVHGPDGLSSSRTVPNYQDGCSAYSYPCGEQLHAEASICRASFPSQVGALAYGNRPSRVGGSGRKSQRTRLDLLCARPSIWDSFRPSRPEAIPTRCPHVSGTFGYAADLCGLSSQSCKAESSLQVSPAVETFGQRTRYSSISSNVPCRKVKARTIRVQEITVVGRHKVYDITVPHVGHYFAEGTIHHNSSKTHTMSKYGLCDYLCFPENTLILMSSTDLRGLELRVWGDVKDLFKRAKERFKWLPGKAVDHLHGIFTDDLSGDDEIRNIRRGIICIPCIGSDNRWKGLGSFIGIKQKRRRLLADEMQLMEDSYFDALANLNKGDFKGVFVGNPIGENDPLDKISEPKAGWDAHPEPEKTETWDNRFPEGRTINFVGSDSPNFDEPKDRYPYLVNQSDIDYIASVWGRESYEMYNQALGIRKPGLDVCKVITRDMCRTFGAHESVIWANSNQTRIYAVDAAYGGDRCVAGWCEFGDELNGKQVLRVRPPCVIPISVNSPQLPEDQIAAFIAQDCVQNNIPPSRMFHDSTGRGSLGTAIARIWSSDTNPVEFGGGATERPVCSDLYIWDEKLKVRRLKRCDEHYEKFVTELWFSVRYAIEGKQVRELPKDVMDEGCNRKWVPGKGNRKCIEKKEDVKARVGKSPDLFDWLAIIVEGARRNGFQIARLENEDRQKAEDYVWKRQLRDQAVKLRRSYTLDYKA